MGLLHLSVVIYIFTNLSYRAQHYIMEILKIFSYCSWFHFSLLCAVVLKKEIHAHELAGYNLVEFFVMLYNALYFGSIMWSLYVTLGPYFGQQKSYFFN